MADGQLDLAAVKSTCETIVHAGSRLFSWKWDDYFGAVLAVIPAASQQEALRLFGEQCGPPLEAQSLARSPEQVRAIVDSVGGLRSGQKAFVSDQDRPASLLVTWWPWGNGTSISVRVKLLRAPGVAVAEGDGALVEFRGWFGV